MILRSIRLFVVALALAASVQAQAQNAPDATARQVAALRLVEATRVAESTRALYRQQVARIMGQLQSQRPEAPGRAFDILEDELEAIAPSVVEETTAVTVELYRERFTTDELNVIAAFYESTVGQKALNEMRAIAASRGTAGQEIGQRLGEIAAAKAMERIRSEGLKLQ